MILNGRRFKGPSIELMIVGISGVISIMLTSQTHTLLPVSLSFRKPLVACGPSKWNFTLKLRVAIAPKGTVELRAAGARYNELQRLQ